MSTYMSGAKSLWGEGSEIGVKEQLYMFENFCSLQTVGEMSDVCKSLFKDSNYSLS